MNYHFIKQFLKATFGYLQLRSTFFVLTISPPPSHMPIPAAFWADHQAWHRTQKGHGFTLRYQPGHAASWTLQLLGCTKSSLRGVLSKLIDHKTPLQADRAPLE